MKKLLSLLLAFVTAFSVFGLVGCGEENPDVPDSPTIEVDENKTQIVFNFYNGGHGSLWATNAAIEWNKTNDKYQVVVAPDKEEWYSLKSKFQSGTCTYDIIHNTPLEEGMANGWLEDLTDLWNSNAKGETATIASKFKNPEQSENWYSYGDAHFAVPLFDTFSGFVYDHEIFREKLWLIGEDGELIKDATDALSAGRDGVTGTYDDGQPTTMAQYFKMINAIKSSGASAYLWTGKFTYYLDPMLWSIAFDYEGYDNSQAIMARSGEYTNPVSGGKVTFTRENAYEIFNAPGFKKSLDFIDDYVCDPTLYNDASAKYGTSHTDAQKTFVYGNAFSGSGYAQTAFLYEGNWWEREAIANFNSLEKRGETDYAFGTRDYRYMLPPALDENSVSDSIPLVGFSTEPICVKKQTDPAKRAAIVDFLQYLYSDASLKQIMLDSNGLIAYNVNVDGEMKSQMTKFHRNCYELYSNENSYVVSLKYGKKGSWDLYADSEFKSSANDAPSLMLRGAGITTKGDADDVFTNTLAYYTANPSHLFSTK